MAITEASVPPKPTTEATAALGKMSEITVYMVADHPWWAAAARAKKPVASHTESTRVTKITGRVRQAHRSDADLRARFTDQPRDRNQVESPPPQMLPVAVTA